MGRCRFINDRLPEHSLYSDAKRAVQPGSRASWRISPEPFWLPPEVVAFLEQLGGDLQAFYRALNSLYFASVRGTQPGWVADYLDRGRPDHLQDYGRLNRTRSHLPRVIRPDLFLTPAGGFVATELVDHIADPGHRALAREMAASMRTLRPQDIANAVVYAVTQPEHVAVNELLIRPTDQTL